MMHFLKLPSELFIGLFPFLTTKDRYFLTSCNRELHELRKHPSFCWIVNIHTLDLSNYRDITNISASGNVYSLNLSGCNKITDVSGLSHVHTLNLSGCNNITDVSILCSVYNLNLSGCNKTQYDTKHNMTQKTQNKSITLLVNTIARFISWNLKKMIINKCYCKKTFTMENSYHCINNNLHLITT